MKRSNDDGFARRLHESGAALTPTTSEELHARVMADARRERPLASSSAATHGPTRARWWWMAVAAAGAGAAAVVLLVTTSRESTVTPAPHVEITHLPTVPSIEAAVVEAVEPVREKLHEARFAYLDRDTKRLARFLIRAVPGVPADAKQAIDRDVTPSSASGT